MTVKSDQLEPVVEAVPVRTTDELVASVVANLTKAVEGIVTAGCDLIELKTQVAHGQWLPLLEQIGISHDYAKRLMTISRNPAISNSGNCHHFPNAFRALAELARMNPEDVEAAIESGDITPDMTIRDAKDLVDSRVVTPKAVAPPPVAHQPSSAPARPRKDPLPQSFSHARMDLDRCVRLFSRLTADDRFRRNTDTIRRDNLGDLIRLRDQVTAIIDQLGGQETTSDSVAELTPIDWSTLDGPAKVKLERMRKQVRRELEAEFEPRVQAEIRVRIDGLFDDMKARIALADRVIESRKGIFTRAQFAKLRFALHADQAGNRSEDDLNEAMHILNEAEIPLMSEQERPTSRVSLPPTFEELKRMRRTRKSRNADTTPTTAPGDGGDAA